MSHEGYNSTISEFSIISQENNGAMGDIIPIESSLFFADDECDNNSTITLPRRENFCIRCKAALETRARVCRTCYNIRRTWMPVKPTRKLRQKRRRPSFRQRSMPIRYAPSTSRESSSDVFLNAVNNALPAITQNKINLSSESSSDFKQGMFNTSKIEELLSKIFFKMTVTKTQKRKCLLRGVKKAGV